MRRCHYCGQQLSKAMWEPHFQWNAADQSSPCQRYTDMKEAEKKGMRAFIECAAPKLKKLEIEYEILPIQAQRQMSDYNISYIDCYFTEASVATIVNNFKGKALNFLLERYCENDSFYEAVQAYVKLNDQTLINYCKNIWMDKKMEADKGEIHNAVVDLVRMTTIPMASVHNPEIVIREGKHTGMLAFSREDVRNMHSALRKVRRAVDKTCRRPEKRVKGQYE